MRAGCCAIIDDELRPSDRDAQQSRTGARTPADLGVFGISAAQQAKPVFQANGRVFAKVMTSPAMSVQACQSSDIARS
jgi:hypothetical protein